MGLFGKKKQETEYASAEKRTGLSAEPLPDADNTEENEVSGDRMVCRRQLERALSGDGQGVVLKFYIENFKRMNELFGFAYCEELLKEILEYLKEETGCICLCVIKK